jgi:hypothetical protein
MDLRNESASRDRTAFRRHCRRRLPAEVADAVDNLHGTAARVGQVAAVEDQVGSSLPWRLETMAMRTGYQCARGELSC